MGLLIVILSKTKNRVISFDRPKNNNQRCFPAFVPQSRDSGEAGASLNSPQDESAVADMTEKRCNPLMNRENQRLNPTK